MMKKALFFVLVLQACIFSAKAQEPVPPTVHKPEELVGIMKRSRMTYTPEALYIDIKEKDYSGNHVPTGITRDDSDGRMVVRKLVLMPEAQKDWDIAELAMEKKMYKDARKHYKNVMDIQADYYPAKIQIGKAFEMEDDLEKAEGAYKQAIGKNYVDYIPHLMLAKAYYKENKMDEAINEITLASILNRNDTAIQNALIDIYVNGKLKYADWTFNPQYQLLKGDKKDEIKVQSQKGWAGYAMGKAIWAYEPGYPESQGEKPGVTSLIEEKECLLNMLANQDEKKQDSMMKAMPALRNLQDAKDYKLIDAYVYYEILLRQHPEMVMMLPNNVIKNIKNYVIMAHGGEAPKKK